MILSSPTVSTGLSAGSTGEPPPVPAKPQHLLVGRLIIMSLCLTLVPVCGAQNNLVNTSPTIYSPSGTNAHMGTMIMKTMSNIIHIHPCNIKSNILFLFISGQNVIQQTGSSSPSGLIQFKQDPQTSSDTLQTCVIHMYVVLPI